MTKKSQNYGEAILEGFRYLLSKYPDVFVIGQGIWSPWYVGSSMTDLDKEFGINRIIDTPISESACTGIAVGASLCGYRPIILHPRMDFMVLASDPIVNQAAKWSHMFGGQSHPAVTIRGIINRGGEQGAQHSQALHSWYSHIPGLRVVMPSTVKDARDLLIASVLCNDPVLYIDDRWLYENTEEIPAVEELSLKDQKPQILKEGKEITLVGCGYSTHLCIETSKEIEKRGISTEIIDMRILNPIDHSIVLQSVKKTGRLIVVDGGWKNCGMAGEIIAGIMEEININLLKTNPVRITLPDAPAPTSSALEDIYYPTKEKIAEQALQLFN